MASLFVVLAYSVCRCQSEQKQMILTIEMDSLVLTEGDEAEIRLRIHGITSKINSYTFRLEYEMTSKFRKQRMRKKKNIVWNPQEGDSITLSEMITECDSYHIQICSVSWEDLTGMYKVKKEFNKQISFLVMPKRYEMGFMQEKIARRDLMEQGFEYDGVRKYQEGDRISRVHWNLYAATGGLWVRKNEEEEEERVAKEDRSMVRESVTEDEIAKIISRWTGIPVAKLTESERNKTLHLDKILHERVVGQDEAVELVTESIIRSKAGIKDPTKPIGSFLFLWLVDCPISMTSLLGFLMLVGTVVNNGILYVDTANQYRATMDFKEAVIEAGATRMRPMFMTTLTTIVAMIPMAAAYGNAGKTMQGLALVDVGGLIVSTAMALLVLPVFYVIMSGKNQDKKEIIDVD